MSKARKRTLRKKLIGCFCIAAVAANMAAPVIPVISDMGVITAAATYQPSVGTEHNVVLYSDGSILSIHVVDDGDTVDLTTTTPTKDGCTFGGWYTDEACTNEYDFDSAVTGNMTLYARWTAVAVDGITVRRSCRLCRLAGMRRSGG